MSPTRSPATGSVLVGVDGSVDSLHAVTWAAHYAARTKTNLRIVHASLWTALAEQPRRCDRTWNDAAVARRARRLLETAVTHAHDVEPRVPVEAEFVYGDGPRALARAATGAALVAVGRRGLGTSGTRSVGDAAASVEAQMAVPVVVCAAEAEQSHLGGHSGSVVLGMASVQNPLGQGGQQLVIEQSFSVARCTQSTLTIVHAWSGVDWGSDDPVHTYLDRWTEAADEARACITQLLAPWRERHPDVSVQIRLTDSRPAHALIESSERASLVIIGTTERGPSDAGRLGPVARRVVRDAQSAVMVVPSLAA
jgi:nucleotide-binding universal stress UspA family protein